MHAICYRLAGLLTIVDVHGWCVSTVTQWIFLCVSMVEGAYKRTHTHTHSHSHTTLCTLCTTCASTRDQALCSSKADGVSNYCIRLIFRGGFIFVNFTSRVLFANLTTRENIYLRSRRMNATCVHNTSSTVHSAYMCKAGSLILPQVLKMSEWYWFLRALLSSIANLTTRENVLKSRFAKNLTREIYGIYSSIQSFEIWKGKFKSLGVVFTCLKVIYM